MNDAEKLHAMILDLKQAIDCLEDLSHQDSAINCDAIRFHTRYCASWIQDALTNQFCDDDFMDGIEFIYPEGE